MALFPAVSNVERPNQQNSTGDPLALIIAQYGGSVEGTIERKSVLKPYIPMRSIRGTNTITDYAVGKATLGVVTPGEAPAPPGKIDVSKQSLTVDTVIYARDMVPLLDNLQTAYNAPAEFGKEHGKQIAKFVDQAFFIQGAKAALRTSSAYDGGTSGKPAGHFGGSQKVLAASGDATDPAKLYSAISDLFVTMEGKDVSPRQDDVFLVFRPAQYYALQDAEQVVNGQYVTADGTKLDNVPIFKAWGCPVLSSNNLPNTNITTHELGANYTGDFTKLVGLAIAPRALMAGETIALESDVYYDKVWKHWFIDSHLSFGVTANRAEYAGAILLP